ncbi:hypothetical protein IFO69_03045 [Echinicola sp. CAU 1574]|uniref:Tetratricopeptide repeat protein n=1 Tax=Echinicola arenosa TaxID=2774144 RepID=A0ABR9AG64_9BACT|nr:hypothetical protein [Echinicola arenosa]MBD8487718.1 hypothetical protein [Echinicola arenosa]
MNIKDEVLFKKLPIIISVIGSFLLLHQYFFAWNDPLPIEPGVFSEMADVPLDIYNWGIEHYRLEVENYLLFQNFETLAPVPQVSKTLLFGGIIWLLVSLGLSLISTLKRYYFIAAMAVVIFLLTISGVNSLNIGGISSNLALIILILGVAVPAMVIHIFYDHFSLMKRTVIITPISVATMAFLVLKSNITQPELMMAENITLMAIAISSFFVFYIGHALVGGFFLLLARLNQGVGLKISWHLTVFTVIYIVLLFLVLLDLTGDFPLPFSYPPLFFLFLLASLVGWFEVKAKIKQIKQPYEVDLIGQSLYWIGFGITVMVFWKGQFSLNRPMLDFLDHWLVYTQIALSLLFFAYLLANFSGFMNLGKPLADVTFQPKFFAYLHMRIGSLIALLSLTVFADGVIAPQLSVSSTNYSADYYYAINKRTEARILFENSWFRYRRNEKAMIATVNLYQQDKQPTAAKNIIQEAFEWQPSVHEILLAANLAHKQDKYFDALFYLEKGLELYPDNDFLQNNLALLHSKGNRSEAAFEVLAKIDQEKEVANSNIIGLQVKHKSHVDEAPEVDENLIGRVNTLAFKNLKGEFAHFSLSPNDAQSPTIKEAIIRNQWTNKPVNKLSEDLQVVDSLSNGILSTKSLEELRISKIIRNYQEGQIAETLKQLNGLILDFEGSAGYFHALAAKIMIGQGDFEKAAIELIQAESKGYRNFTVSLLPILYFGNQIDAAFDIKEKFELDFPEWMKVNSDEGAIIKPEAEYFKQLSQLNKSFKSDFLNSFKGLEDGSLKAMLGHEILIKKSHWLNEKEIQEIQHYLLEHDQVDKEYISQLADLLISKDLSKISSEDKLRQKFQSTQAVTGNPYLTPFVFMAVSKAKNEEDKYEILRNASDFNKDPLLWIEMVRYSQKIGLSEYGQEALKKLSKWVEPEKLEKLKLQTL